MQTESENVATQATSASASAQPGSRHMPPWSRGELDDAPKFNWKAIVGPGVVMAGAAIGGGEWLMGPTVTAKYGGSIMWVATLSILFQVIYNIEASRYTLYTGEPIMIGKFRTLPGPIFWLFLYLILDFGSLFPYLAANAATPVGALILGKMPNPKEIPEHKVLLQWVAYGILALSLFALTFGGKVYNALKAMMFFKVVFVLGFLSILGLLYSRWETWAQILPGLFQFGSVPVEGGGVQNIFVSIINGNGIPNFDETSAKQLATFAAIAGVGGLSQMSISNYTREQGWGMGKHVGAIPSLFGGRNIELSHVGTVFEPTPTALERWKRWLKYIFRDQLIIWAPACIIGIALPSMLSIEFIPRNTVSDEWTAAGMTATAVQGRVGGTLGHIYWYIILFCGFLVLMPSTSSSADGFVRRWVDVSWTAIPWLHKWQRNSVKVLYFSFLGVYFVSGLILLSMVRPQGLILIAGNLNNLALGFSCWHTLYVNSSLLPKGVKPGIIMRVLLFLSGLYFLSLATFVAMIAYKEYITK